MDRVRKRCFGKICANGIENGDVGVMAGVMQMALVKEGDEGDEYVRTLRYLEDFVMLVI